MDFHGIRKLRYRDAESPESRSLRESCGRIGEGSGEDEGLIVAKQPARLARSSFFLLGHWLPFFYSPSPAPSQIYSTHVLFTVRSDRRIACVTGNVSPTTQSTMDMEKERARKRDREREREREGRGTDHDRNANLRACTRMETPSNRSCRRFPFDWFDFHVNRIPRAPCILNSYKNSVG